MLLQILGYAVYFGLVCYGNIDAHARALLFSFVSYYIVTFDMPPDQMHALHPPPQPLQFAHYNHGVAKHCSQQLKFLNLLPSISCY